MAEPAALAASRMRTAVSLHRVGVDVMRQNLRRRNPEADEKHIGALLRAWMRKRPGAELGDTAARGR